MPRGRGPDKSPREGSPRNGQGKEGAYYTRPARHRWARALALLLEGKPVAVVAQELATTPHTVRNWMHHPDCKAELVEALDNALDDAQRRLQAGAYEAADQLATLSKGATKEQMAQVKAAAEVLDRAGLVKRQRMELEVTGALGGKTDEELLDIIRAAQDAPPPAE